MFSLIMTNPPFGVNIKKDDRDNLGQNSFSNFEFGKTRKTQVSDILFLEQYKRFLVSDERRNPRAGIVLSNGVLNNPTNKKLLEWMRLNFQILAVVSLPIYTFRKAGSGMKTCLLFVKKYPRPYQRVSDIPDYQIFLAIAKHIGYDSTLRPDTNDLPSLNNHYINHTEDRPNGIFWMSLSSLEYRLDPTYYYNKFIIATHFERLRSQGHKLVPLHDLLAKMNAGKSPEGGVTRSTGEIPSITITNMTKDGTLDFSEDINFVPDEFYDDFNRIRGKLELLDILIAKDGATTGKTTIIDEHFPFLENAQGQSIPKAIISEHIFRLRTKTGISPTYVNAFLNSELGQLQLETVITGGAQGGITRDFVKAIYVPIIIEQEDIAKEWVDRMRQANAFKNQYENSIRDVKESIEEAISHATPISEEQLQQITTVSGDIEENEE
ncbi:MAG: N-6 DNA methylase [Dehalococcoidales bacterium]|jgi:hypothetical protein|nr:N-6 DNA methylase [Dehalococcoidales bacterium]